MMKTNQSSEAAWGKLQAYLANCVERNVFAGADFAMVTCDEERIIRVGNRQSIPHVIPNEAGTLWDLASVSKVVATTTCILKLMEDGALHLKSKVSDILPEFERTELTVRHLLTHTSGMPADVAGYKEMSVEQLCKAICTMPYAYEPGTKVVYSDINFIALGWIIAKLKGSLDGYAKQAMFEPLGMSHTCYNPSAEQFDLCAAYEDLPARGGIIRGSVHDGKAHVFNGVSGHAGVFSTIEDLIRFVRMLLNDGTINGEVFLHEGTMGLLRKNLTPHRNERRTLGWIISDPNYGLGDYFSEHTLFHTGFSGSSVLVDLDRKVAFINCCNRIHPSRSDRRLYAERNQIHNLAYQCI
ncbi:MAG: beta-lactamase family protein [Erysipelotrichaceae bacterium]|nr:beta-lactamase family protein [Erysipelotrichaceae bacterium]